MDVNAIEKTLAEITQQHEHSDFIYDFLRAYGTPQSTITKLRQKNTVLEGIDNIVELKQKIYFISVAKGNDLPSILERIKKEPATFKHRPRFLIVTDFNRLCAWDCKLKGTNLDTKFEELHVNYEFFLPLAGREKYVQHYETYADVKAAEKMAKVYDEILKNNPDFQNEQNAHNLNVFLTRLLFCFFAEDTGIFPDGNIFTKSIFEHTQEDGSDLHTYLELLFASLDDRDRSKYPAHISNFPYVNGKLFADKCKIPKFTKQARDLILECGDEMNWSEINPDIFGSMFQAVSNKELRRGLGQHYTSVPNIMKVITPLFLDELNEAFDKAYNSVSQLSSLWFRISEIKIFDPACGSGNFLIIAYKRLRMLEIEIIKRIRDLEGGISFNLSQIKLSNFFGIEIDDFPCEIARLSLYLAQHQMNQRVKDEFGITQPTLPLQESGHIVCGNATRLDWDSVCPRIKNPNSLQEVCDKAIVESSELKLKIEDKYNEIYVLGNPPYLGAKLQKDSHKADLIHLLPDNKNLDYISCWFYKGAEYLNLSTNVRLAFVSTNSISQGQQVAILWKQLKKFENVEIGFAYRSFKWTNNAKYNAGVTCVIIGLRSKSASPKVIYDGPQKIIAKNINAYLLDANDAYIERLKNSISNFTEMVFGSMPRDGGHLILDLHERDVLIEKHSQAEHFIKKYIGAEEFINGKSRYCLWIEPHELSDAESYPEIQKRIYAVSEFRNSSKAQSTKNYARFGYMFVQRAYKPTNSIIVPRVSSERRQYIPIGYLNKDTVISDSAQAIYDAPLWLFSVITSRMHMVWVRAVGGRLKTDYRYSAELCYNTFPFPDISAQKKRELEYHAKQVLRARENHSELTMAELYDPEKMPEDLRSAHESLDIAVEQCYRKRPFDNDEKRLEYLFKLYEKMSSGVKLDQPELEIL